MSNSKHKRYVIEIASVVRSDLPSFFIGKNNTPYSCLQEIPKKSSYFLSDAEARVNELIQNHHELNRFEIVELLWTICLYLIILVFHVKF